MDYKNDHNSAAPKYQATRNFNATLENPQFNTSDTYDVNLGSFDSSSVVQTNAFNDSELNKYNTYEGISNNVESVIEEKEVNNTSSSFENNNYNAGFNNIVDNGNTFVNNVSMNDDNVTSNNYYVADDIAKQTTNDNFEIDTTKQKTAYKPTGKKRKKKASIAIPSELKILIILVIIILAFIYVIPSLYEFFRSIRLSILG